MSASRYGVIGGTIRKFGYLTVEQQLQVLEFVERLEAEDEVQGIRIIVSVDVDDCGVRFKKGHSLKENGGINDACLRMVNTVVEYARSQHQLLIGIPTAIKAIMDIGSASPMPQERTLNQKGRDMTTGLPGSRDITSIEIREVISDHLALMIRHIVFAVKRGAIDEFGMSPDELAQYPIYLRGGFARLYGLAERLQEAAGLKVIIE